MALLLESIKSCERAEVKTTEKIASIRKINLIRIQCLQWAVKYFEGNLTTIHIEDLDLDVKRGKIELLQQGEVW